MSLLECQATSWNRATTPVKRQKCLPVKSKKGLGVEADERTCKPQQDPSKCVELGVGEGVKMSAVRKNAAKCSTMAT